MWNHRVLYRIDFRTLPIIVALMVVSIFVLASTTSDVQLGGDDRFFTSPTKSQIERFLIGIAAYLFFALLDYRKLRNWAWPFYAFTILLLFGLFFTDPIVNVHRWYRLPFIPFSVQPTECAKLSVVLIISWFIEKKGSADSSMRIFFQAFLLVLIPMLLIVKQPDLGSALALFPIALGMFYFGGMNKKMITTLSTIGIGAVFISSLIFLGLISHETIRPYATKILKEYQYERFNPDTYHHRAAQTAIALGKYTGSGWRKSEFTGRQFLPAAHTDSVFPAYVEEFGLIGAFCLLGLFFGLIYYSFQVTAVARDHFGRLLSAGIAMYLAVHVVINIGMMCGFLPITGVPLPLITYGGSSVFLTMAALGILQSIYARRFMF
jgi:rod shape determining protein RodA